MKVIQEPLFRFLTDVRHRLVIVGSVARGNLDAKDLDFLWDVDNDHAGLEIRDAIKKYKLAFGSPFIGCWSFMDYGWMVELLITHHGPSFKSVRRHAKTLMIQEVGFFVARPKDAPNRKTDSDSSDRARSARKCPA